MKNEYCTQHGGDCQTCSLSSYGKDCRNNALDTTVKVMARNYHDIDPDNGLRWKIVDGGGYGSAVKYFSTPQGAVEHCKENGIEYVLSHTAKIQIYGTGANQLIADTINGVHVGEAESGAEILNSQDFYEALASLKVGKIIYGLVDDDTTAKIEAEYGIH